MDVPWRHREDDVTDRTLAPSKAGLRDPHDGIIDSMDMSLSKLGEMVKDRGVWRAVVPRVANSWT